MSFATNVGKSGLPIAIFAKARSMADGKCVFATSNIMGQWW